MKKRKELHLTVKPICYKYIAKFGHCNKTFNGKRLLYGPHDICFGVALVALV